MRIFWLGMHKLLTRTELPRLRTLGFEVFNPPYLSPVADQSANLDWDAHQPTTLPREVFDKLSRTNFFYEPIGADVAELLNKHFDVAIVTIHPGWLTEFLRAFRGKVIYRTYGQIEPVSNTLLQFGALRLVTERPDFWFVPHSPHTAASEHAWLKTRMEIVPYHLGDDVVAQQDSWAAHAGERRRELMLVCPNIDNLYYRHHYLYLKQNFPNRCYRFYGVQMRGDIEDPQVVGTLPRANHLAAYQHSAGLVYTYDEPDVCYLPPIEMMVTGGPVIYLPGSLLARMFGGPTPGLARTVEEAHDKARRLLQGDRGFIDEVIAAQTEIRKLYLPSFVNPRFDTVMQRLLAPTTHAAPTPVILTGTDLAEPQLKRLYIYDHYPHRSINFKGGEYVATDGIPRVMRKFCRALLRHTPFQVVVTAYASEIANAYGYFADPDNPRANLRIMPIESPDAVPAIPGPPFQPGNGDGRKSLRNRIPALIDLAKERAAALGLRLIRSQSGKQRQRLVVLGEIATRSFRFARRLALYILTRRQKVKARLNQLRPRNFVPAAFRGFFYGHIDRVNADERALGVINPHYYFFMDALSLKKPLAMYLPDYIPHFYRETGEFKADENLARVSRHLVEQAQVVFTNSQFSASYLPRCYLKVAPEKLRVFPLPPLNAGPVARIDEGDPQIVSLKARLGAAPFLFYPTQNRPNKNLPMLLKVFALLRRQRPELKLVLTCYMDHYEPAEELFERLQLEPHVIFARGISDQTIAWLYKHCACLPFTSNMEGNFPPQVYEALAYGAPIVATRLPLITEKLGDRADDLLLVDCEDVDAMAGQIATALDHRSAVLARQQRVADYIKSLDDEAAFAAGAVRVACELGGIAPPAEAAAPVIEQAAE